MSQTNITNELALKGQISKNVQAVKVAEQAMKNDDDGKLETVYESVKSVNESSLLHANSEIDSVNEGKFVNSKLIALNLSREKTIRELVYSKPIELFAKFEKVREVISLD